jgi:hypothetical protein
LGPRLPGLIPVEFAHSAAETFLPSSGFTFETSICPPCAVMRIDSGPMSVISPILPFTAPNVRTKCFLEPNSCSFLPPIVVHAPGAGSAPRMVSWMKSTWLFQLTFASLARNQPS